MTFIVIGISDSASPALSAGVQDVIAAGRVFSGGKRHHSIVEKLLPDGAVWIDITANLDAVFAQYVGHDIIVVFASGDPLFFGFASTIMRRVPDAVVKVLPSFNSLQALAHRVPMSYEDMRVVSLTGRPWAAFDQALIERAPKIGVLTDGVHTPAAIAHRMVEYGYDDYELFIGENLGNEVTERVSHCAVTACCGEYTRPNCLILRQLHSVIPTATRPFGLPDKAFELLDGRERMITKMPIRLLTLQALELSRARTFWDIGFCTGSVSIEARLAFPHLAVCSFEVRPEGQRLMDINSRRFGAPGITTIIGDFLTAALDGLPRPEAVFIGGHGGRLAEVMTRARSLMGRGGVMVMNSVTPESRSTFIATAASLGMVIDGDSRVALDDNNPIHILRCRII